MSRDAYKKIGGRKKYKICSVPIVKGKMDSIRIVGKFVKVPIVKGKMNEWHKNVKEC